MLGVEDVQIGLGSESLGSVYRNALGAWQDCVGEELKSFCQSQNDQCRIRIQGKRLTRFTWKIPVKRCVIVSIQSQPELADKMLIMAAVNSSWVSLYDSECVFVYIIYYTVSTGAGWQDAYNGSGERKSNVSLWFAAADKQRRVTDRKSTVGAEATRGRSPPTTGRPLALGVLVKL